MNAVRRANPVEREKTASGGHNWQGGRHGQEKATQRSDFALQKNTIYDKKRVVCGLCHGEWLVPSLWCRR